MSYQQEWDRFVAEWTHQYTRVRACPTAGYGHRAQIKVCAGLHQLGGNRRPYFSVTAEIFIPGRRDYESGGCLHTEVLKYWPKLAPVVALHLSDDNGTPMHAQANSWYQLAGYYGGAGEQYHAGNGQAQHWLPDGTFNGYRASTPEECLQGFAHYVRIPLEEARELAETWASDPDTRKAQHAAWIRGQAERWQAEATAAITLLDALAAEEG